MGRRRIVLIVIAVALLLLALLLRFALQPEHATRLILDQAGKALGLEITASSGEYQLRAFHAAVGVTGLVVTKLDGSAKGGVLFALAREFNIPIRYVGLGEKREDLRIFDPEAFVDALLPAAPGA